MRPVIIGLIVLGIFLEVSGLIWSSKGDNPSDTFLKLAEPPSRAIQRPLENGYFLLIGFAAASGSDPVQTGYDIWMESDTRRTQQGFDLEKTGRSELRLAIAVDEVLPAWNAESPVVEFRRRDALMLISTARYSTLLARYHQWLKMRFEDWGYAHSGVPRLDELMAAHRFYIAEGFAKNLRAGVERLAVDVTRWRYVLRGAHTISMKVLAEVLIEDDIDLLSRIIHQPTSDHAIMVHSFTVFQPLTTSEYSLRWPVKSEFMAGYRRSQQSAHEPLGEDLSATALTSLAQAAGIQPEVFRSVEHPPMRRGFGMAPASQRTWDRYAAFYEATIQAAESVHSPLPKLRDVVPDHPFEFLERVAHPFIFEPTWEPFSQRLLETDARLRLVSLQILLQKADSSRTIPSRLAEVGSMYFDPFTGFPMLWIPTQRKIYSVGKDGLDDGGDPIFDISVPLAATDAFRSSTPRSVRR